MNDPRPSSAVQGLRRTTVQTLGGFRAFLLRGNLVEMAVAFVIGAAFGGLVKDFVTAFIGPLLALFGGKPDFTGLRFTINGTTFPYGVFLTSAVAFFMTALVLYFFVVLPTSTLIERFNRGQSATERECPLCLSEIPRAARRCRFCTADIPDASTGEMPRAGAGRDT